MSDAKTAGERRTGGCLCGAVRFSATPTTHDVDACHCGMCRRWTGGAYLAVSCENVVIGDSAAVGVYRSSDYGERAFCKTCGSSLIWRMKDGSSAHVAVSAFDDVSGFSLAREIFVDDKPAFYDFADPTRKLTGAEFAATVGAGEETSGG